MGLAIGRTVPSINPQIWLSGAPFLCIASANRSGSNHVKYSDVRRGLNRVYRSSMILKQAIKFDGTPRDNICHFTIRFSKVVFKF
jgi:hypothetical protein